MSRPEPLDQLLDQLLDDARARRPEWSAERSARVFDAVRVRSARRDRRRLGRRVLAASAMMLALVLALFRASASDAASRDDGEPVARVDAANDAGYARD